MITAVDSSVPLDVLITDPRHGQPSAEGLRYAAGRDALVACDVVWAEVAAWYGSAARMQSDMDDLGITFSPTTRVAATIAGSAWARYRQASAKRTRVVADFLIGAHASTEADGLLTRDRRFHRRYFAELTVIAPGAHA